MTQGQRRLFAKAENSWVPVKADHLTNALVMMSYMHHKVHDGELFQLGHYASGIAADGTLELRFATGNSKAVPHMLFEVETDLGCLAELYKGTAKTHVGGNAITPVNHNDNFDTNGSFVEVCHTPGGAGDGTLFGRALLGGNRQPGDRQSGHEFVLAPNTAYLLKCTAFNNNTAINAMALWYERIQPEAAITTTTTTTTTGTSTE